jgi:GT2 family glycosyltransferase
MSLVPIIIPYFREQEKLRKALAAIEAQTHTPCEAFVRDNTNDNILFTAAVNEGLNKYAFRADIEFVMVLNQDAYLDRDCIARLLSFMHATPDCGIACPLQVLAESPATLRGVVAMPGPARARRRVTWGGSRQAFPLGVHESADLHTYTEPRETFWANGACMLIRTALIREIGVFDKNMRFICSDADFSFTARSRGWSVYVVPQALAEHGLAASSTSTNRMIDTVKAKDIVYFGRKWLSGDLYRELSYEGQSLTRIGVRKEIEKYQKWVDVLEGRASSMADYLKLRLPS